MNTLIVIFVPFFLGYHDVPRECVKAETFIEMRTHSLNLQLQDERMTKMQAQNLIKVYEKDYADARAKAEDCVKTKELIANMSKH